MSRVRSSFKIIKSAVLKYAHQVQIPLKLKGEIHMKNKNKIWLKIAKISGVVLIVLCVCMVINHYSFELIREILTDFPLFFVLYLLAMLAYLVMS